MNVRYMAEWKPGQFIKGILLQLLKPECSKSFADMELWKYRRKLDSEEAKLYHNVIQTIYGIELNTVDFQPSTVVTMVSLDRLEEFCIAKTMLELHSAEKTIKDLFERGIFFKPHKEQNISHSC